MTIPPLAIALADPRGVVKQAQETISITDLVALLEANGLGTSPIVYDAQAVLGSTNVGVNDGDNVNSPLQGIARTGGWNGGTYPYIFQLVAGAATSALLFSLNGRRTMQPQSTAAVDGLWMWRPGLNGVWPIPFHDVFPTGVASMADAAPDPAYIIRALFRKRNAGDSSDCHFFFGATYARILSPARQISRIGLLGDGAGGYRFGSVNCPDGGAAGQNAPGDIDANAFQPAGLVVPGTNWWEAAIKIVPPTPTQGGMWGAYFNGDLVATFNTVTNFPRGYNNGGGPINDDYRDIELGFGVYNDGVAPVVCPCLTPPRVQVTNDHTLPATLELE
jgi:hypothetical protein